MMRAGIAADDATALAVVPDLGGVAMKTGSSWTVRQLVAAVTAGCLCNWHDSVEYFRWIDELK